ncbi:MAG: hypothetical protein F6K31_31270, partial [Symploca sp. SIO2G7]|nr:hypothetical protein [Symploca sp. SIO2G7]
METGWKLQQLLPGIALASTLLAAQSTPAQEAESPRIIAGKTSAEAIPAQNNPPEIIQLKDIDRAATTV